MRLSNVRTRCPMLCGSARFVLMDMLPVSVVDLLQTFSTPCSQLCNDISTRTLGFALCTFFFQALVELFVASSSASWISLARSLHRLGQACTKVPISVVLGIPNGRYWFACPRARLVTAKASTVPYDCGGAHQFPVSCEMRRIPETGVDMIP